MMRKHLSFFIVLFIFTYLIQQNTCISQESGSKVGTQYALNNVIPSSPTMGSLEKYIDGTVNYYTGSPQIGIPIYTARSRDLNLPVSIFYSSSGVRVDDIASWAGLGWSLNAGGYISRTMRGLPDEKTSRGYLFYGHIIEGYGWDPTDEVLEKIADGVWDMEPDIFTFNFNGRSGKFVFGFDENQNWQIYTVPHEKLKIITPRRQNGSANLNHWTIITEDGTKYVFGNIENDNQTGIEHLFYNTTCGLGLAYNYKSKWFLRYIISPIGSDTIEFKYKTSFEQCDFVSSITKQVAWDVPIPSLCVLPGSDAYYHCQSDIGYLTKKIEWIYSANCNIHFESENGRKDLVGTTGCVLKSINICDKSNQPYKRFNFYTSYLTSTGNSQREEYRKRLKLDSIVEVDPNNSLCKPPYVFEYNEDISLPPRRSLGQDWWGYPNGVTNNNDLIPGVQVQNRNFPGANRNVNTTYLKSGILEKIYYPTGGYTQYVYEPHDYGIYVDEVITKYATIQKNKVLEIDCIDSVNCSFNGQTKTFFIDHGQVVDIRVRFKSNDTECSSQARLLDQNDNWLLDYGCSCSANQGVWDCSDDDSITLTRGEYKLYAEVGPGDQYVKIEVDYDSLKIVNDTLVPEHYEYAGGLRIKKIVHNDGSSNNNELIREFTYRLSQEPSRSSGILISTLPRYYYFSYKEAVSIPDPPYLPQVLETCTYLTRTSSAVTEIGLTTTNHIGYKEVTEHFGTNGSNGSVHYKYTYFKDSGYNGFPFPPKISKEWMRGKLLSKTVYDNTGNRQLSETFEYGYNDALFADNCKYIYAWKAAYEINSIYPTLDVFRDEPFEVISGWAYPIEKVTTTYDKNGLNPVRDTILYFYDNPLNHIQVSKTISKNSDESKIERYFEYAGDYPDQTQTSSTVLDSMVQRNMIAIPIKETIYVDDQQTDGNITNYGFFNPIANSVQIRPKSKQVYDGESYSRVVSYDKYDQFGNLLQYTTKDDVNYSINYGYNDALPIAQVENASWQSDPNNYPNGSLVTLYDYDPLVGLLKITQPNGLGTHYEYDGFGRLKLIKDHDNNINERYQYNYAYYPSKIRIIIDHTPSAPFYYEEIQFSAITEATPHEITQYDWDFGDNTTQVSQSNSINHQYSEPRIYTVSLTATDEMSAILYTEKDITADVDPLSFQITGDMAGISVDDERTFTASYAVGGYGGYSYKWEVREYGEFVNYGSGQELTVTVEEIHKPRLIIRCTLTEQSFFNKSIFDEVSLQIGGQQ